MSDSGSFARLTKRGGEAEFNAVERLWKAEVRNTTIGWNSSLFSAL